VIASNFQNAPERDYINTLAHDLDVEVRLLENITDDRLVELYNQAKLTVYAPVREPLGLVPLESMACGTPVVAVREGGMLETMVHERTGLLVEREPDKFASAVVSLLTHPQLADEYGNMGRQHVLDHWTWDQAATTLENYFVSVVG
jgi:glycosyltransferase involved in cell wall biosynthesis